jgi:hypothetical protein
MVMTDMGDELDKDVRSEVFLYMQSHLALDSAYIEHRDRFNALNAAMTTYKFYRDAQKENIK